MTYSSPNNDVSQFLKANPRNKSQRIEIKVFFIYLVTYTDISQSCKGAQKTGQRIEIKVFFIRPVGQ
jgi:hypothetical protein